jgi:hypothetical protein
MGIGGYMSDEVGRIWKETKVSEVISPYSSEGNEEMHKATSIRISGVPEENRRDPSQIRVKIAIAKLTCSVFKVRVWQKYLPPCIYIREEY